MQMVGEVQVAQGATQEEQIGVDVVVPELLFMYSPDWQAEIQVFEAVSRIGVELLWLHYVQFVETSEHWLQGSIQLKQVSEFRGEKVDAGQET